MMESNVAAGVLRRYKDVKDDIDDLADKVRRLMNDVGPDYNGDDVIQELLSRVKDLEHITAQLDVTVHLHSSSLIRIERDVTHIQHSVDALQASVDDIEEFKTKVTELDAKMKHLNEILSELNEIQTIYNKSSIDKNVIHTTHMKNNTDLSWRVASEVTLMELFKTEFSMMEADKVVESWKKFRMVSRAYSISEMMFEGTIDFSVSSGDKTSFSLKVTRNDNATISFTLVTSEGTLSINAPFDEDDGTTVIYTLVHEYKKIYPYDVDVSNLDYNYERIAIYSDVNLRGRAYSGQDYTYDDSDVILKRERIDVTTEFEYVANSHSSHSTTGFVGVKVLATVYDGDTPLVHLSSLLCNEINKSIFDERIAQRRNEVARAINDDAMVQSSGLFSAVAGLSVEVNNLNAVVVRAVSGVLEPTQESETMEHDFTCIPHIDITSTVLPDIYGGYPTGNYRTWWMSNDYLSSQGYANRKVRFQIEVVTKNLPYSFANIVSLTVEDSNGVKQIPCRMLVDVFITPAATTTKADFRLDNDQNWDCVFLHVQAGRSERGSDNDNTVIRNGLSVVPSRFLSTTHRAWLCAHVDEASNAMFSVRIYPPDAFPLTSTVKSGDPYVLKVPTDTGIKDVVIPLEWKTFVERENGEERLVFQGTGSANQLLKEYGYISPLGEFAFSSASATRTEYLDRFWRQTGVIDNSPWIINSSNAQVKLKVNVERAEGGNSIANDLIFLFKVNSTSVLPDRNEIFKQMRTKLTSCVRGLCTDFGTVKLIVPKHIAKVQYIRDPLGVGSVSYVDYDLANLAMRLNGMQSQLMELQELVESLEKRLKLVEDALASMSNQSGLGMALTVLASVASYVNPMAGIVAISLSAVYNAYEMAKNGVTPEGITMMVTNGLDILNVIGFRLQKPPNWIRNGGAKYDVPTVSTLAQEQLMKVRMSEVSRPTASSEPAPSMLKDHYVQVMAKPLDGLPFKPKIFDEILVKIKLGTATPTETAFFNAFTKIKLNPTHQYLRMSNCRKVDDDLIKDVWIFGIGDGYADLVKRAWLGTRTTGIINRETPGWVGPGVFKMSFVRRGGDEWELMPARSSGMTNEEILVAGGMTKKEAATYISEEDPETINTKMERSYNDVVDYYLFRGNSVQVQDTNMQLMDGQLDALMDVIKKSNTNSFTYSLIGNNCQHFTDDIVKFLKNPINRPPWMQEDDYLLYMKQLDDNFGKYTS